MKLACLLAAVAFALPCSAQAARRDNPFFDLSGDFRGNVRVIADPGGMTTNSNRLLLELGGGANLAILNIKNRIPVPVEPGSYAYPFVQPTLIFRSSGGVAVYEDGKNLGFSGVYHVGKNGFQFSLKDQSGRTLAGDGSVQKKRLRKYLVLHYTITAPDGFVEFDLFAQVSKRRLR